MKRCFRDLYASKTSFYFKKNGMNKDVIGEKAVRKEKFSVAVWYAAQIYQFINLTPLAVGRSFSLD